MYCVTLRLHNIKKLTLVWHCLLNTPWKYIHLADAYILPFWWKSSLHFSIIVWVAIYNFVINFTKSKLITRSVLVLKLPGKKKALFLLLGIYQLLRNQVSAENIGIKVSGFSNTQLITFYYYISATNSIANYHWCPENNFGVSHVYKRSIF